MKARIFAYTFFVAVISMLIGAVQNDSAGLANMAAVSIWAYSAAGIFAGVMACAVSASVSRADGESLDKCIKSAREIVAKTDFGPVRKTISWLMSIAIVLAAAYAGLVATAAVYVAAVLLVKLGVGLVKHALEEYDEKAAKQSSN